MEVKEQVKNSLSIVDVVGRYVNLQPAGKNYKGLCPFHSEKTPSFFVMPEKNSYTCFGCKQYGDVLSIVMEMEGLGFVGAMNFLIDTYSLNIQKSRQSERNKSDAYFKINDAVRNFFSRQLEEHPEGQKAWTYLSERGINDSAVRQFQIGYAPNSWDTLYLYLKDKGVSIKMAVELGLLVQNDRGKIYDRFRGRLMFPILSESGKTVAFGGRTLFDESSKYLNSPETPVYKKSEHLFGFFHTKQKIREKKTAVLVEGYFDVISLYQGGIDNVAGGLGTALTSQQIYLLKRFADKVYLCYDNDKAGVNASVRGIEMMLEHHLNSAVIDTGLSKDPDDFIREHGLKGFLEKQSASEGGFNYLVRVISDRYDVNNPTGKRKAVNELLTSVNKIDDTLIRDEYIKILSDSFGIDPKHLYSETSGSKPAAPAPSGKRLQISTSERILLQTMLSYPDYIEDISELLVPELREILPSRHLLETLIRLVPRNAAAVEIQTLLPELSEPEGELLRHIVIDGDIGSKARDVVEKELEEVFKKLHDKLNRINILEINKQIRQASRNNNGEKLKELMSVKNNYIKAKYSKGQEG